MTQATSGHWAAPGNEQLLPCEQGSQAAAKEDAVNAVSSDLQSPVLEIEWRTAEGIRASEGNPKAVGTNQVQRPGRGGGARGTDISRPDQQELR